MGKRVDVADLAGVKELGDVFGVTAAAVCNWAKRYDTFPQPVAKIGGTRIYRISEVRRWKARNM